MTVAIAVAAETALNHEQKDYEDNDEDGSKHGLNLLGY